MTKRDRTALSTGRCRIRRAARAAGVLPTADRRRSAEAFPRRRNRRPDIRTGNAAAVPAPARGNRRRSLPAEPT